MHSEALLENTSLSGFTLLGIIKYRGQNVQLDGATILQDTLQSAPGIGYNVFRENGQLTNNGVILPGGPLPKWDFQSPSDPNQLTMMWVAAHPDDELVSQRLIFAKYCADLQIFRCVFVIATKGEAAATGPEFGYDLGLRRDEEMRCSAKHLNGDARFLGIWNGEDAEITGYLDRMVRVIREVQPDIIITLRPTEKPDHAMASNMASEAFKAAADPSMFPEQLQNGLETWQTSKIYTKGGSSYSMSGSEFGQRLGEPYNSWVRDRTANCHWCQIYGDDYGLELNASTSLNLIDQSISVNTPENDLAEGLSKKGKGVWYMRDWLLLGPLQNPEGDLNYDYLQSSGGEENIKPVSGMQTSQRTWQRIKNDRDYINFKSLYAPDNFGAAAYAFNTINLSAALNTNFRISSHDGVKVWVNGQLVHTFEGDRAYDYEDFISVQLNKGNNDILIKVVVAKAEVYHPNGWDTYAKITWRWPSFLGFDSPVSRPWGFFAGFNLKNTSITNIQHLKISSHGIILRSVQHAKGILLYYEFSAGLSHTSGLLQGFTPNGKKILETHLTNPSGVFLWDGRDVNQQKLPVGVYLFQLTTSNGEKNTIGVLGSIP